LVDGKAAKTKETFGHVKHNKKLNVWRVARETKVLKGRGKNRWGLEKETPKGILERHGHQKLSTDFKNGTLSEKGGRFDSKAKIDGLERQEERVEHWSAP